MKIKMKDGEMDKVTICETGIVKNPNWQYRVTKGGCVLSKVIRGGQEEVVCFLEKSDRDSLWIAWDFFDFEVNNDGVIVGERNHYRLNEGEKNES